MGTVLEVRVEARDRQEALTSSDAAFGTVRRMDDLLSTWRDDSELARLNRAVPGQAVRLAPELAGLLAEVLSWSAATEGAFDPAIGALVDAWDLRGPGRRPSAGELRRARSASGLSAFVLDRPNRTLVRRRGAAWLDSGGFGKGAALRAARDVLLQRGIRHALLNFGGQLVALGAPEGAERGRAWVVWVAHPFRREERLIALRVSGVSLSTTSQSERFVEIDGQRFGHVLDPRTGRPVRPWGSVTVVSADPLAADILSTALYVLGPEQGLAWARERAVAALFLVERDDDIAVRPSPAMQAFLTQHSPPSLPAEKENEPCCRFAQTSR